MKRYITILFLTMIVGVAVAQPTRKTLVKTLALNGEITELIVDVEGAVDIEYWDQPTLRIVTDIEANVPEQVLKALVAAGRYDYNIIDHLPQANLVAPNQNRKVIIGGHDLNDEWTLHIYLPKNVQAVLAVEQLVL